MIEAALRCFEDRGYDQATTAQIAAEAGVGVGTLYGYFRDKREILLEIVERSIVGVAELVDAALDPARLEERDAREIIQKLTRMLFHSQALQPGIQRVLWERYFKDEALREPMVRIRDRMRAAIDRFAAALAERGQLRAVDGDWASFVVLHAVQWNATQAFMHASPEEADAAAAATAELVSRYLLSD
ncbi:MAG: TetR/AcrR family transcriptional regulator [Proteobacteria bacterium]|nr:TetR/AcrR family transcriptional regulator [Pseudomonadota bacterium]